MTVYTELLPPTKSEKHWGFRFAKAEADYSPICGTIIIESTKQQCEYILSEFPTGWDGRGFHFDKVTEGSDPESESYDVFLSRTPGGHTCDCKGFTYSRGAGCKHIACVLGCIENNWL